MSRKLHESREEIIEKIIAHINKKLPAKQALLAAEFVRQYYANIPLDDLTARDITDLYGVVLSHWHLVYQRAPGESKIHIYNPHYEQHGWSSTHTVIELVHNDMPFLVDSLRMEIERQGYNMHLIIHLGGIKFRRDSKHQVIEVLPFDAPSNDSLAEAPIYIEIDRETTLERLEELQKNLERVLKDVTLAVTDWQKMRARVDQALVELEQTPPLLDETEIAESKDFLRWLKSDHFTFLGCRDYVLVGKGPEMALQIVRGSGLGVLRDDSASQVTRPFASLPPEARRLALSPQVLIISKTNTKATVHRPTYTDYIGVKRFDEEGNIIGERRFIGLYTSVAYNSNPKDIPFLRRKVDTVMTYANLPPQGHAAKALVNILETLPRDDLFQSSAEELFELAMGILNLQERKKIRLFVRKDIYNRFVSCFVYIPKEDFNTELQYAMQDILLKAFAGLEISFSTQFSESVLARIHFLIRINPHQPLTYDVKELEGKLIEVGRSWRDELTQCLIEHFGEETGSELAKTYGKAFPAGYRDDFNARTAVYDIEHIEAITPEQPLGMLLYQSLEEINGTLRFKLFLPNQPIPLSDVLPLLENMGLKVMGERPHELILKDGNSVWINDFGMVQAQGFELDVDAVKDIFQDAFRRIWNNEVENDGLNRLVLSARLSWREVTILRAYIKYLRQTGFTFSQAYIEEALTKNPAIARHLVDLFKLRFDPNCFNKVDALIKQTEEQLYKEFDNVANLDEDRILRRCLDLIRASLRTNYFQQDAQGCPKAYLSFKLNPAKIPELPLPRPMFEIFVYAPDFEGVHLRGAKVARGGLRWSDRREDFRTEVLGLMKAQQVKNVVIVPSGAKGGFVPKNLPADGNREATMSMVIKCYQNFIRGLLDITDNLQNNKVVPPKDTVHYDEDDPYLVVAADKGTATFSDIANQISQEYGFWLGDAFASGGSAGYDHKKMGITAKGAWESVKRHFRELGINTQETDFTVIGIGDMAGDVFGNGMLLSKHIKLVGAFNHMHIFLDPDPDPLKSFEERKRLFDLPRSSWEDYNTALISKGGGIYLRSAKAIKLSPQVMALLGLESDVIVPNDLIRAMLKANVDLLWNGGIGTYVKAASETHIDVGDRTNDALRVNGNELRCRVIGEGGNLGCTQLGRMEYALNGGLCYTDFIDNSAGVDCSDHEVNSKILLNAIMVNGDITEKQRNILLAEMTQEVAELVLEDNYYQTQAISLAANQAIANLELYRRYMEEQERKGKLDRALEFLPDDKALIERKALNKGLTRPEIAILLAYCKIAIKQEILASNLTEDPYLSEYVEWAFPIPLRKRYRAQMEKHRLRREIIATQISNIMINDMGIVFVHRLQNETGASVAAIVRAYTIVSKVLGLRDMFAAIEALDYQVPVATQADMITLIHRLVRRSTRWFLRNQRITLEVSSNIERFEPGVAMLCDGLDNILPGGERASVQSLAKNFTQAGVPIPTALRIAKANALFSTFDIVEAALDNNFAIPELASVYFAIGERLELNWFREQITAHAVETQWDSLARAALRDDLDWLQRGLAIGVIRLDSKQKDMEKRLQAWQERHKRLVERWQHMVADLRAQDSLQFIVFYVAVRELLDLTQASLYSEKAKKGK